MKFDMGGSAAVLGAAKAIGQIKPAGVEVSHSKYVFSHYLKRKNRKRMCFHFYVYFDARNLELVQLKDSCGFVISIVILEYTFCTSH